MPCIGVGVFDVDAKNEKILIGKRRDSELSGLPGGCWSWEKLGRIALLENSEKKLGCSSLLTVSVTFTHSTAEWKNLIFITSHVLCT